MSSRSNKTELQVHDHVRTIYTNNRVQSRQSVDQIMTHAYWHIGEAFRIAELHNNQVTDFSSPDMEQLANDLDLDTDDLQIMMQFYQAYPNEDLLNTQLSWSHYRLLIEINDQHQRETFEKQIIENNWTPGELSQKSKEIH